LYIVDIDILTVYTMITFDHLQLAANFA